MQPRGNRSFTDPRATTNEHIQYMVVGSSSATEAATAAGQLSLPQQSLDAAVVAASDAADGTDQAEAGGGATEYERALAGAVTCLDQSAVHSQQAAALDLEGQWEQALAAQQRAVDAAVASGDLRAVDETYLSLGLKHKACGHLAEAAAALDTHVKLRLQTTGKNSSNSELAITCRTLACLHLELGEIDACVLMFNRSLRHGADRSAALFILEELGDVYLRQFKPLKAADCFEEALALAKIASATAENSIEATLKEDQLLQKWLSVCEDDNIIGDLCFQRKRIAIELQDKATEQEMETVLADLALKISQQKPSKPIRTISKPIIKPKLKTKKQPDIEKDVKKRLPDHLLYGQVSALPEIELSARAKQQQTANFTLGSGAHECDLRQFDEHQTVLLDAQGHHSLQIDLKGGHFARWVAQYDPSIAALEVKAVFLGSRGESRCVDSANDLRPSDETQVYESHFHAPEDGQLIVLFSNLRDQPAQFSCCLFTGLAPRALKKKVSQLIASKPTEGNRSELQVIITNTLANAEGYPAGPHMLFTVLLESFELVEASSRCAALRWLGFAAFKVSKTGKHRFLPGASFDAVLQHLVEHGLKDSSRPARLEASDILAGLSCSGVDLKPVLPMLCTLLLKGAPSFRKAAAQTLSLIYTRSTGMSTHFGGRIFETVSSSVAESVMLNAENCRLIVTAVLSYLSQAPLDLGDDTAPFALLLIAAICTWLIGRDDAESMQLAEMVIHSVPSKLRFAIGSKDAKVRTATLACLIHITHLHASSTHSFQTDDQEALMASCHGNESLAHPDNIIVHHLLHYFISMTKIEEVKKLVEKAGGHVATSAEMGVSLTWDADCDLDLHCLLPGGDTCNYSTPNVGGYATLDVDKRKGSGNKVENLFIKESGRPSGTFRFKVQCYSGSSSEVKWTAIVSDMGRQYSKQGTFTSGDSGKPFQDIVALTHTAAALKENKILPGASKCTAGQVTNETVADPELQSALRAVQTGPPCRSIASWRSSTLESTPTRAKRVSSAVDPSLLEELDQSEDLTSFLEDRGLAEFTPIFVEFMISVDDFQGITDDDLQCMGIEKSLERRRILRGLLANSQN